MRQFAAAATCLLLAACGSTPRKEPPPAVAVRIENHGEFERRAEQKPQRSPYAPAQEDLSKRGDYTRGGLYAPGVADSAPQGGIPDVHLIPEPEVRDEPHSRYGNRSPYTVLGKQYRVLDSAKGYDETGMASYYGNKFHGRRTSNLEVYDMYAFTAAHKTLPLPSYARVTNLANGKSVVVRVNDRGPFHDGRIIDLSFAAAVKLGVDRAGTARVEVQGLSPGEDAHQQYDAVAATQPTPTAGAPATAIDRLVAVLPVASADAGELPPLASGPAPASVVPVSAPAPASAPAGVVLQVATFAARENAERALAMLDGAGITGARLQDGDANGRQVWRLRVGPVDPAATEELGARLRGLGFGQPQRVHE
jgi:rare lipoprotein A